MTKATKLPRGGRIFNRVRTWRVFEGAYYAVCTAQHNAPPLWEAVRVKIALWMLYLLSAGALCGALLYVLHRRRVCWILVLPLACMLLTPLPWSPAAPEWAPAWSVLAAMLRDDVAITWQHLALPGGIFAAGLMFGALLDWLLRPASAEAAAVEAETEAAEFEEGEFEEGKFAEDEFEEAEFEDEELEGEAFAGAEFEEAEFSGEAFAEDEFKHAEFEDEQYAQDADEAAADREAVDRKT
ncbi:MAG: hypothetical protein ISN29_06225 [Gammaproteobacteria bacterium AqS3]|nr:hypothetical protein [Gammaproteobacteria bacterium AqS3]